MNYKMFVNFLWTFAKFVNFIVKHHCMMPQKDYNLNYTNDVSIKTLLICYLWNLIFAHVMYTHSTGILISHPLHAQMYRTEVNGFKLYRATVN